MREARGMWTVRECPRWPIARIDQMNGIKGVMDSWWATLTDHTVSFMKIRHLRHLIDTIHRKLWIETPMWREDEIQVR